MSALSAQPHILGTYNAEVPNATLIVGNGGGNEWYYRSNGLVVLNDGSVQVPSGRLMLGDDIAVGKGQLVFEMSSYLDQQKYLYNRSFQSIGTLVVGDGAYVSPGGENNTAVGGVINGGSNSTSIGSASSSSGIETTAVGAKAMARGDGSTAIGYEAVARAKKATALGVSTYANSFGEVVVGLYNYRRPFDWPSSSSWIATDMQFVVGNGSSNQDYSNALEVQKNGRTRLINKYWNAAAPTAVPSNATEASNGEALSVEGHAVMKGNTTLKGNTVLEGKVTIAQPQGDISMGAYQ